MKQERIAQVSGGSLPQMQGRNATRVPLQKSIDVSDKDLERGGHRINPSINSYLDYSGVIRDRINEGATD